MDPPDDLRSFLQSGRPAIELEQYRTTYRRTRITANLFLPFASVLMGTHFEHAPVVIGGIVSLAMLILLHSHVRRSAPLLEMIGFDTVLYIGMTVFADAPEISMFVAVSQLFILFYFVGARTAIWVAVAFLSLGCAATGATLFMDAQVRTPADSLLLVVVVVVLTAIPTVWTQLRAGGEMHRMRARQEELSVDKDRLLDDKDRFLASVSHELRTPLTAVIGLAHTLAEGGEMLSDHEKAEFLKIMLDQGEEVAAIVDDLLVAARAETGHLSLVIQDVDMVTELSAIVDASVVVAHDGALPVVADPIRTRQILRNLLSNAARYGGDNVRVRMSTADQIGVVSVEDDGPPIDEEELDVIFAAYGRAHQRPGRTDSVGLGLTVSRQLARLMGGDVVYCHEDGWSRFVLTLPLSNLPISVRREPGPASRVPKLARSPR